ncbi:uncharacterized protein LOC131146104 isoform X2 [Malania oleifera]|uniref:uncharacterized protein LOC131146104 isoform X2 n=1 Tax=Malania oleifera TaxID=397392 RepID=UPI0025ADA334|nr:uncharacterized protein LOC131146104 isoform X2 [Malania oleifera]
MLSAVSCSAGAVVVKEQTVQRCGPGRLSKTEWVRGHLLRLLPPPPIPRTPLHTLSLKLHPSPRLMAQLTMGSPMFSTKNLTWLTHFNHVEKYNKYEADYVRRLQAKYFSRKNLYGGNIFDEKATIDGETIKSSRWPCTRSYADPVWGFEDLNSSSSTSTAIVEALTSVPNGKHVLNKSC